MAASGRRRQFAAQLLFQFRVRRKRISNKRRVCEMRTIVVTAQNGRAALAKAKRYGESEQFDYLDEDRHVYFEFVGIKELLDLDPCTLGEPLEVWWDLVVLNRPKERRARLLPQKKDLRAFSVVSNRTRGPKL